MRKIKLIHTIYSLNMGGAETIVKDYSLNFNKNVFDFTLICIKRMNTPYESILEQHGVNVIFISDYNKLSLSLIHI